MDHVPVEQGEQSSPSELPAMSNESHRPVVAEMRLLSAVQVPARYGRLVGTIEERPTSGFV